MKLIHLSDLHLGKRLNDFSLLEDQSHILKEILAVIDAERPDALLVAGDVYDKSVPSAEAMELFDDFLVSLAGRGLPTFIISGNHDSPERLAFANRLIDGSGIHIAPAYGGAVEPFRLRDEHGEVNIYLLPFIKPAHVRRFFPDAVIDSYTDALRTAIEGMHIDESGRNVLVTHQFITGAARADSEDVSVGGTDNVDSAVLDGFDYVALGHLHTPQMVGSDRIRYAGTPLKYSFSEVSRPKSVSVVELGCKGAIEVRTVPLLPLRELAELRGRYDELTLKSFYENTDYRDAYLHITLTDEEDIPEVLGRLRVIYRRIVRLDYDNRRSRGGGELAPAPDEETRSPLELFAKFYERQNNAPLSAEQRAFVRDAIEMIWEEQP